MTGGIFFILVLLFQPAGQPAGLTGHGTVKTEPVPMRAQPDTLQPEPLPDPDPSPADTLQPETEPVQPDTLQPEAEPVQPETEPARTDTIPPAFAPADTTGREPPDGQDGQPQQEQVLQIVPVWLPAGSPVLRTVETDSTMRWFMALNRVDRLYREPGVITYRTGRLGHPSGIDIHSYEKRHQNLRVNEMEVSDPVTGQINWNRVPIHKIGSIRVNARSYSYRSEIYLREHYTVQPMTFLNFDEGSGDYRNLEFSFTHNITPRTNLELSFWDRRDGDQNPRNQLEGRQIVTKFRYNLTDRLKLKAGYINNGFSQEQPFGYNVPNPALYHFNPFNATALETSASSDHSSNDLYFQLWQRANEESPPGRGAGIHYQTDNWELHYSQDSTAYSLRDVGAFFWQEIHAGASAFRLRGEARALRDGSGRSLTRSAWAAWNTSLRGRIPLFPWLETWLEGRYEGRDDSRSGYESSAGLVLSLFDWLTVEGFGGAGSAIPELQSLYWNSAGYRGDETLLNETGLHTGALAAVGLGPWITAGVRTDSREITNGIFVDPEGVFVNIDPYRNLSTSAWLELDSPLFEGLFSATLQEFVTRSGDPVNLRLREGGERLWLKGSFHWKNYLFNRAAFVKAGLSGMITPGDYTPADFVVPLNRWQHGGESRFLPGFHRLDFDLTARIRWFMLMIRYENILDGVQQLGYFEADSYPMPARRFIMGFRIVFTN